jgi:hypothetical protein
MNGETEFEKQVQRTLEDSVARLDGATRSRLTQARHRALEQLDGGRSGFWSRLLAGPRLLAPVGAVAAVVALSAVLWVARPDGAPVAEGVVAAAGNFEDIDLLADSDALAAMSEEDPEFYEWAAAQDDASPGALGT